MQINLYSTDGRYFFQRIEVGEGEQQRMLCKLNILRLTNDLWRKIFRRANVHSKFEQPENTCYVMYALY